MVTLTAYKKNRLKQLVQWGYITQSQANQLWRDYLRLFKRITNQKEKKMKTYEVECPCGALLEIDEQSIKECPDCGRQLDDRGTVQQ